MLLYSNAHINGFVYNTIWTELNTQLVFVVHFSNISGKSTGTQIFPISAKVHKPFLIPAKFKLFSAQLKWFYFITVLKNILQVG